MTTFGEGASFAAQCSSIPMPDGWRIWYSESDGPLPEALEKRAVSLATDANIPLGTTESYPLPGVTTLLRVEPRAWSRNDNGELVQGCFRATGVYLPSEAPEGAGAVTPPSSRLDKTIGILTAVSLTVGITATLATWGSR